MIKDLVRKNVLDIRPYEPGKPIEELKRELDLSHIIKMASNENPLGPSTKAVKAMNRAISGVNRYPDGNAFYLKEALARHLNVTRENLVIGNGSNDIIELILRAFAEPGEEVIIGEPSFLMFKLICRVQAADTVIVPLKDFRADLDSVKKAVTARTKLVIIDNPNNPVGTSIGEAEVERFLEDIPESLLVVFDEAYNEFVERTDFPDTVRYIGRKNVIVIRTFSKAHALSGLRVGYAIAEKDAIDYLNRVRQPFNVNSLAQAAAAASLEDREHIDRVRMLVREGKAFIYEGLDDMGLDYVKSDTNFILIDVRANGRDVFRKMLKEGVIIRDMGAYKLDNFIRVTVGTMAENRRFLDVLQKVLGDKG